MLTSAKSCLYVEQSVFKNTELIHFATFAFLNQTLKLPRQNVEMRETEADSKQITLF